MKRCSAFVFVFGLLGAVCMGSVDVNACEIEAVINWYRPTPYINNDNHPLAYIHEEGWDGSKSHQIPHYAAWGCDVFVPQDCHTLGKPVKIKYLAGMVAWTAGENTQNSDDYPKTYEVWRWVDVNNNSRADEGDLVWDNATHGWREQNWKEIAWGNYPGNGVVFNLFDCNSAGVEFVPGVTYLLIIKANGAREVTCPTCGKSWALPNSSWDWYNAEFFKQADNQFRLDRAYLPPPAPEWDACFKPNKYGPPWYGVDDYEILWIRFNQPPPAPFPRKK